MKAFSFGSIAITIIISAIHARFIGIDNLFGLERG
jgi:hypothetical protein